MKGYYEFLLSEELNTYFNEKRRQEKQSTCQLKIMYKKERGNLLSVIAMSTFCRRI
jgi:hypothetical protein